MRKWLKAGRANISQFHTRPGACLHALLISTTRPGACLHAPLIINAQVRVSTHLFLSPASTIKIVKSSLPTNSKSQTHLH